MTFSWLHSVSQFLGLVGLLAASWISWRIYRWRNRGQTTKSSPLKPTAGTSDGKLISTLTHDIVTHGPVVLIAISSFCLGVYISNLNTEFHSRNFDEMRDVTIIERLDPYTFRMQVDDPDTHQPRAFGVRFCPDYEPTHEMQAGVKLTYLKFQRKDFDNCWEIAPKHLGYGLWRDHDNKPIRFSTGQTTTETAPTTDTTSGTATGR